jgi:excisionase family DNA binding protein
VLDAGLLSRDDAAKILGIAPLTLSRWVSSKKIRAYRVARRLRFSRGHLHEYLERVEVGSRR